KCRSRWNHVSPALLIAIWVVNTADVVPETLHSQILRCVRIHSMIQTGERSIPITILVLGESSQRLGLPAVELRERSSLATEQFMTVVRDPQIVFEVVLCRDAGQFREPSRYVLPRCV